MPGQTDMDSRLTNYTIMLANAANTEHIPAVPTPPRYQHHSMHTVPGQTESLVGRVP